MFRRNLNKSVANPVLRRKLTPDYPMGSKRILVSYTLFPALAQDDAELVTEGVDHFSSTGITTADGTERQHDVVMYGTGFQTNPFLQSIEVEGRGGKGLHELWQGGVRAFLGIAVPDFPNLYVLYGPNTNTGHSSIVFKLEAQIRYIVQLVQQSASGVIDVRKDVATQFDKEIQSRLSETAWDKVAASWYKDGGRITNNCQALHGDIIEELAMWIWPTSDHRFQMRRNNRRKASAPDVAADIAAG